MTKRSIVAAAAAAIAGMALVAIASAAPAGRPAKPATPAAAEPAAAAEAGIPPLQRAHELYDSAHFADAAELLGEALRAGRITGDDVNSARALRASCLVKAGRRLEAKEGFKSVLRSDAAWRPDPVQTPPDEMDVFRLALREFQAEQVEAGKRYPASLGGWYGWGQCVNQTIVDLASSAGTTAAPDFSGSAEFGYSVRLPLRPRWSVDIEVSRLRATTADQLPPERNAHAEYTVTGLPIVASLMYHFGHNPRVHVTGFAGAGIMPGEAIIEYHQTLVSGRIIPTQILGRSTGAYLHVGAEAEYHLQPRLAVAGRLIARRANSGHLQWPRDNFELYETYAASVLGSRSVDFSGISASLGVRAYIGY